MIGTLITVATGAARMGQPVDGGAVAFPDWRVMLDGEDLTAALAPVLMRLRVSERRGDLADQLDIDLDDSGQRLAIPKAGAELQVFLGWKGGGGTKAGLIDKGKFIVDEAGHRSPPDTISIRARSADFTAEWRKVRNQSWKDTTLGAVLKVVAARQGLTLKIAAALSARAIKLLTQSRESDVALLERIGKEHDAISTVKNGTLIFAPMAGGKSASGSPLETVKLHRSMGDGHDYRIEAREDYTGVVAKWHDKRAGKQKTVKSAPRKRAKGAVPKSTKAKAKTSAKKVSTAAPTTSAGSTDNPKILRKIFATKAEADRAAASEWSRIQRAPRKLSIKLALGRPEIGADQPVIADGYHPEIDAQDWIVGDVSHTLDRSGLTTAMNLEVPDNPPEGGAEADADPAPAQATK